MNEFEKLTTNAEDRVDLCVEITAVRVAELIAKQLVDRNLSRADFAKLLDVTPGRVTQILDGDSNLQIRTIARALAVFDLVMDVNAVPMAEMSCPEKWESVTIHPVGIRNVAEPRSVDCGRYECAANASYALAA